MVHMAAAGVRVCGGVRGGVGGRIQCLRESATLLHVEHRRGGAEELGLQRARMGVVVGVFVRIITRKRAVYSEEAGGVHVCVTGTLLAV